MAPKKDDKKAGAKKAASGGGGKAKKKVRGRPFSPPPAGAANARSRPLRAHHRKRLLREGLR